MAVGTECLWAPWLPHYALKCRRPPLCIAQCPEGHTHTVPRHTLYTYCHNANFMFNTIILQRAGKSTLYSLSLNSNLWKLDAIYVAVLKVNSMDTMELFITAGEPVTLYKILTNDVVSVNINERWYYWPMCSRSSSAYHIWIGWRHHSATWDQYGGLFVCRVMWEPVSL